MRPPYFIQQIDILCRANYINASRACDAGVLHTLISMIPSMRVVAKTLLAGDPKDWVDVAHHKGPEASKGLLAALIRLVVSLGMHSITAQELKLLFTALKVDQEGEARVSSCSYCQKTSARLLV